MIETLTTWKPRALSVLRIIMGLMIIEHGMGKIFHYPALPAYANIQPLSLLGAAGFIELIGGALLILGLLTQPAAFIVAGEMAVAYFMVHAPKGFYPLLNGGTLAIAYCFTCLYLSPVKWRLPISVGARRIVFIFFSLFGGWCLVCVSPVFICRPRAPARGASM